VEANSNSFEMHLVINFLDFLLSCTIKSWFICLQQKNY